MTRSGGEFGEPWQACGSDRGGCRCGQIWSVPDDNHILTVAYVDEMDGLGIDDKEERSRIASRAAACVNALRGTEKPGEYLKALEKFVEQYVKAAIQTDWSAYAGSLPEDLCDGMMELDDRFCDVVRARGATAEG